MKTLDGSRFGLIFYEDKYRRKQKAYLLNRDAFIMLAMGSALKTQKLLREIKG